MIIFFYIRRQVGYDASVDIYLTAKTIHDHRPGVWTSPANILALYRAVEVFLARLSNNKSSGELDASLVFLVAHLKFSSDDRQTPEGREDKNVIVEIPRSKQY